MSSIMMTKKTLKSFAWPQAVIAVKFFIAATVLSRKIIAYENIRYL